MSECPAYFADLKQDCRTLGIRSGLYSHIYDYSSLSTYVAEFGQRVQTAPRLGDSSPSELKLDVTKRAIDLARLGIQYQRNVPCCDQSEPKHIQALDPTAIQNTNFKSPVLLTYQEKLAGVVKRFGERTLYGFEDIPHLNIYKGLFHTVKNNLEFIDSLPLSSQAWKLPLEETSSITPMPIRFSIFTIPVEARAGLEVNDDPENPFAEVALHYTHEELYENALAAHESAIDVRELAVA